MTMHAENVRRSGWLAVARIASRLLLALVIFLGGYLLIYRPRQLRWGATDEEVARAMPGDQVQPQPIFNATRAITIGARPEQIWPWLVQMGYKRAGFYGYDALDNAGIPSADRIIPALQHLKVGDAFPIWEGINYQVVAVDPNHSLVLESSDHSTMVLSLYPVDASHTRLVWRIHNAPYNWASPYVVIQLFTDAVDFFAVRQNMLGIKARAEGVAPISQAILNTEAALWAVMFLGFLMAETGLVVRRDWLRPLLAVSATGLLMVGLVLIKPPVWVEGLVTLGVCVGLGLILSNPMDLMFGVTPLLTTVFILELASAFLTVGVVVGSILAWWGRFWSAERHVHYSLVALAALAFAWELVYWNLLGFRA